MGGFGNVVEMCFIIFFVVLCCVGFDCVFVFDFWFFLDEDWVRIEMERVGFRVDRVEREWWLMIVDKGGVEGWVRLMGK